MGPSAPPAPAIDPEAARAAEEARRNAKEEKMDETQERVAEQTRNALLRFGTSMSGRSPMASLGRTF